MKNPLSRGRCAKRQARCGLQGRPAYRSQASEHSDEGNK